LIRYLVLLRAPEAEWASRTDEPRPVKVTRRGEGAALWRGGSGDLAHRYANPGTQPARFSLAVYEPGVGAGLRSGAVHG
jgi:hypothetical protein